MGTTLQEPMAHGYDKGQLYAMRRTVCDDPVPSVRLMKGAAHSHFLWVGVAGCAMVGPPRESSCSPIPCSRASFQFCCARVLRLPWRGLVHRSKDDHVGHRVLCRLPPPMYAQCMRCREGDASYRHSQWRRTNCGRAFISLARHIQFGWRGGRVFTRVGTILGGPPLQSLSAR